MSKIPTINTFIETNIKNDDGSNKSIQQLIKGFGELVRAETLKVAAEEGETEKIYRDNCDDHTPYRGECTSCGRYDNPEVLDYEKIDKQSILDLVNSPNLEIK